MGHTVTRQVHAERCVIHKVSLKSLPIFLPLALMLVGFIGCTSLLTPEPTDTPAPASTPAPFVAYQDNFDDPNSGWGENSGQNSEVVASKQAIRLPVDSNFTRKERKWYYRQSNRMLT